MPTIIYQKIIAKVGFWRSKIKIFKLFNFGDGEDSWENNGQLENKQMDHQTKQSLLEVQLS